MPVPSEVPAFALNKETGVLIYSSDFVTLVSESLPAGRKLFSER